MGTHSGPRSIGNVQAVIASGGTETVIEQDGKFYRVHSFTDVGSDTLDVQRGGEVEYLVVGGGGGGGNGRIPSFGLGGGSGGGSGGLVIGQLQISSSSISVLVGEGSSGGKLADGDEDYRPNGGNSAFADIVAIGGGGGRRGDNSSSFPTGKDGGSGSGVSRSAGSGVGGLSTQFNVTGVGVGHAGGDRLSSNDEGGSGGGGAGSKGGDANGNIGGLGGAGYESIISGESVVYAEGGTGGDATDSGTNADNAALGSGSGGNGGSRSRDGGSGGSGIVIVRYRITKTEFTAST